MLNTFLIKSSLFVRLISGMEVIFERRFLYDLSIIDKKRVNEFHLQLRVCYHVEQWDYCISEYPLPEDDCLFEI